METMIHLLAALKNFEVHVTEINYGENGPELGEDKVIYRSHGYDPEPQDFRLEDSEVIMAEYYNPPEVDKADYFCTVKGVNIKTGEVKLYISESHIHNECEGIFPDEEYICLESSCDGGALSNTIDLWKLKLDGSMERTRMTRMLWKKPWRATNSNVSPDGKWLAFMLNICGSEAGYGMGLGLLDLEAWGKSKYAKMTETVQSRNGRKTNPKTGGIHMIKRELGNTGLQVSVLGFGSMEIGRLRYEEAEKLLNEALDGGINFVDSSPCYGIAEEYVGKAIGRRRDEYILATKCGCNVGSHGKFSLGPDHIWTADQLYKNIDRSLELLQTEYIDIWQLHGIMPDYLSGGAQDEVIAAAESIKKSGKVRHIAFSCRNGSPDQPMYPALFGYQACKEMLQWDKFEVNSIDLWSVD